MALKLMYITNNEEIARIAERSNVDWIFIDLEINGKEERQGHLDTVISRHHIDDVKKVKEVLKTSELLVRVNPLFEGSKSEIDRVIDDGADIVMLPFFKSKEEVGKFTTYVGGRAKTMLLLETPKAVESIDDILSVDGIDYIHIGLNDLLLGYGMKFMFELLADGTVEKLCNKIKSKGIPYGFGGIAQLGQGELPAEYVIAEHYRLGSSMAILSRSFCNVNKIKGIEEAHEIFDRGVSEVRKFERILKDKGKEFFEENRMIAIDKINSIRDRKVESDEKVVANRGV
jgi:2-keto-3-deoxy-L-rhamnonate aldolase RhmA